MSKNVTKNEKPIISKKDLKKLPKEIRKKNKDEKMLAKLTKDIEQANKTMKKASKINNQAKNAKLKFARLNKKWGIADSKVYAYRDLIVDAFFRGDPSTAKYVTSLPANQITERVRCIRALGQSLSEDAVNAAHRAAKAYTKMTKMEELKHSIRFGISQKKNKKKENDETKTVVPIPRTGTHYFLDGLRSGYLENVAFGTITAEQFVRWAVNGHVDYDNPSKDPVSEDDERTDYVEKLVDMVNALDDDALSIFMGLLPMKKFLNMFANFVEICNYPYEMADNDGITPVQEVISILKDSPEYQTELDKECETATKKAVQDMTFQNSGKRDENTELNSYKPPKSACVFIPGRISMGEYSIRTIADGVAHRITDHENSQYVDQDASDIVNSKYEEFLKRLNEELTVLYSKSSEDIYAARLFMVTTKNGVTEYNMFPFKNNYSAVKINEAIMKEICTAVTDILVDLDDDDNDSNISVKSIERVLSDTIDSLIKEIGEDENAMLAAANLSKAFYNNTIAI